MKKAFGYVRTATKVAIKEFNSIENQTKLIKDYCEKNNIELVKVYSDPAKSGIRPNRPALNSLLKKIKETQVNYLVITDFDRLSRDTRQYLTLRSLLKKAGIEILTVNQGLMMTDPFETLDEMLVAFNTYYPRLRARERNYVDCNCENV